MQDHIPDALINAFERQYDSSWNDPQLRKERLAMRYGWAAAMEAKPCLHQIQEPAPATAMDALREAEAALEVAMARILKADPGHSICVTSEAKALVAVRAALAAPAAVAVPDGLRATLIDVIAQGLSGTWHCNRVWEAWHVGTMSQEDFSPVDESDTPTELADAVLAALAATPQNHIADAGQMVENVREGAPYDNPAFEKLARELGVWGTAQSAVCAQFWLTATTAAVKRQFTDGTRTLRQDCISAICDFAGSKPEDGEDWESWFEAAFDLLGSRVNAVFDEHSTTAEKSNSVEFDGIKTAAPVVLPEPFALYDGEKWYANEEAAICSCANMQKLQKVYTEQQVRALLATGGQAHAVEQEPFGYFKAEPFGWTDCGPDDEGAVALYERPQAQADARDAGRWRMASLIHSEMMKHPDIRAEPEAASAYMKAVHDGVCFEAAIDSAIAAAKGEQK